MKRYTGQQALYEAISRSRGKAKRGSILEKLRPVLPKQEGPAAQEPKPPTEPSQAPLETPEPLTLEPPESQATEVPVLPVAEQDVQAEPVPEMQSEPVAEMLPEAAEASEPAVKPRPMERLALPIPPGRAQTWLHPRSVQFNEGRIEVSVPYYVGLAVVLAVCVVVLAAYRLGQARSGEQTPVAAERVGTFGGSSPADVSPRQPNPPAVTVDQQTNIVPAASGGDHLIVLTPYKTDRDLEPVIEHFARYGIGLFALPLEKGPTLFREYGLNPAALPSGTGFLLLTTQLCSNPNVPGSDGEQLKQRIAEVGALYKGKAPQGYEPFAPHYFSDAYGMKVK